MRSLMILTTAVALLATAAQAQAAAAAPDMCEFKTTTGTMVIAPCSFDGMKKTGKADMSKFTAPTPAASTPAAPAAKTTK